MKPRGLIGGVLILMMFAFSVAEGVEWEYITVDNEGTKFYIDSENIDWQSKGTVSVWVKSIYSGKARESWKELGRRYSDLIESKTFTECNCVTRKTRSVGTVHYDSQGDVIISATKKKAEWLRVPPESVDERIFNVVCFKKGKK